MTERYIVRGGKKLYLVSSSNHKQAAEASRKAIKKYTGSKKSVIVKLSKKKAKKEDAKYGIYIGSL